MFPELTFYNFHGICDGTHGVEGDGKIKGMLADCKGVPALVSVMIIFSC